MENYYSIFFIYWKIFVDLWPKNMKLFGGNFNELFQYLDEKSMMPNMDGIDFKLMFLNPDSDEVNFAHKDQDIFKSELRTTMLRAKK